MAIEPAGIVSLPLARLRALLAASAGWQAWTGTAGAAQAATRVHRVDLPPPEGGGGGAYGLDELREMRPLAVVDEFEVPSGGPGGDAWVFDRVARGAFAGSGKLLVTFEADVPPEDRDDPAAAKLEMMNRVGAVLEDAAALGGGETDHLSVHRIVRWGPYRRSDETAHETQGDTFRVSYCFFYGP